MPIHITLSRAHFSSLPGILNDFFEGSSTWLIPKSTTQTQMHTRMTKRSVNTHAEPALRLSEQDTAELHELSRQLELELLSHYEDYLFRSKRNLDCTRWKFERNERDLRAYSERAMPGDAMRDNTPIDIYPQATLARGTKQRRELLTGSLAGSLEDAMYGATFQDTRTLRAFWASRSASAMDDCAVVATLVQASLADPFRFMGVTWFLQAPSVRAKRTQARDFLTLVDSRLTRLSNGEQIGVVLCHSVQHPDFGEMHEPGTVRTKASILTVYRQLDASRIEVWSLQVVENKHGGLRYVDGDIRERLSGCGGVCYVGLHRKLRWLLQKRRRSSTATWEAIEPTSSGCSDACELCFRSATKLFSRSRPSCQLCYKQVCQRCCVALDLVVFTTRTRPETERVAFCIECMVRVKSLQTKQLAQQELLSTVISPSSVYEALGAGDCEE